MKENGVYLYEFDLLRCKRGCGEELGIIIFDNFNKAWAIQSNNNHTGRSSLKATNIIAVVGNVLLSKEDADTFQEYSDDEDAKYPIRDNSWERQQLLHPEGSALPR